MIVMSPWFPTKVEEIGGETLGAEPERCAIRVSAIGLFELECGVWVNVISERRDMFCAVSGLWWMEEHMGVRGLHEALGSFRRRRSSRSPFKLFLLTQTLPSPPFSRPRAPLGWKKSPRAALRR